MSSGVRLVAEALPDGWLRIELSDWTVAAVQEFARASGHVCSMRGCKPSRAGFWFCEVEPDVAHAMALLDEDPDRALRIVLAGQVGRG